MIFNVGGGGASTAEVVQYDNSKSGLTSDNVQGAVDELSESLGDNSSFTNDSYPSVSAFIQYCIDNGYLPNINAVKLFADGIENVTFTKSGFSLSSKALSLSTSTRGSYYVKADNVDLSDFKKLYCNVSAFSQSNNTGVCTIGISKSSVTSPTALEKYVTISKTGLAEVDVSEYTGTYYVYVFGNLNFSSGSGSLSMSVSEIGLS